MEEVTTKKNAIYNILGWLLPTATFLVLTPILVKHLGTDGFGRSDTRDQLRRFFEVDRHNVAYAALYVLYRQDLLSQGELLSARAKLGIDPGKINPVKV